MRRVDGNIIIDGNVTADTYQCPHCGLHFVSVAGSGKRRAYCARCGKITCGSFLCDICIPIEKKLEASEKGLILQ